MSDLRTITELVDSAVRIESGGYSVERWDNGVLFVNAPSGEGTQIPEYAMTAALTVLFKDFF